MKKLLLLLLITFLFFITPVVPFTHKGNIAYAATSTNYVFGDVPKALDAALDSLVQDMNAVGHVMSVLTTLYSDITVRVFGLVCHLTTFKCEKAAMDLMYKQSLAYYSEIGISQMYTNPPASTYAFIIDTGQSLGFIPKSAYAQGIGFSGLSPLLPLWKVFRNIAYLILALFMIVIGFLIMFRKKIDPKTVVTVQNALPNIVVTLLLITFSYAIVGVLIDFMYLVIMIAISILQPVSNGAFTMADAQLFVSGNFWNVAGFMLGKSGEAALNGVVQVLGPWATGVEVTSIGVGFLGALFSSFSLTPIAWGAAIPPLLLFVLIALAFIIAIIRLFFLLISSYIQIILSLLTAPFQLLLGAFPGNHSFESWIKNLISNLAVFPITAVMLLIGSILAKTDVSGTKLWGPPMLNPGGNTGMAGIIGLGILFAIPSVAGSIKEAMKAKPMVNAGPGAVIGPLGGAVTQGGQALYQLSMIKNMFPKKEPPQ